MTVSLVPRRRTTEARSFRLNNLEVSLFAGALVASGAPDRDLLKPRAYVPSQICQGWSDALFPALSDLVLIEVWDAGRAHLRPRGIVRAPVSLEHGSRRRKGPALDPWAALPPLAERTVVTETPLGPWLLALASWLGTCGGCTVEAG